MLNNAPTIPSSNTCRSWQNMGTIDTSGFNISFFFSKAGSTFQQDGQIKCGKCRLPFGSTSCDVSVHPSYGPVPNKELNPDCLRACSGNSLLISSGGAFASCKGTKEKWFYSCRLKESISAIIISADNTDARLAASEAFNSHHSLSKKKTQVTTQPPPEWHPHTFTSCSACALLFTAPSPHKSPPPLPSNLPHHIPQTNTLKSKGPFHYPSPINLAASLSPTLPFTQIFTIQIPGIFILGETLMIPPAATTAWRTAQVWWYCVP